MSGVLTSRNLLLHESQYRVIDEVHATDRKYFKTVDGTMQEVPKYTPIPSTRVIQYDSPTESELESFKQDEVAPTTCLLCKDPLESVMSVQVQVLKWTKVDTLKTHPVSKLDYMEMKSVPKYRLGRAHVSCVSKPEYSSMFESQDGRMPQASMVHQKMVPPSKTQHTRQEHWVRVDDDGRMRTRHETWRDIPDVVEYSDD